MLRVSALSKINLFLEITGKRSDGYHTLSTIFQTISLSDELTFAPANELTLSCSDRSLPTDERNLVMRAALRLRDVLKEPRGAKIHLKKVVPMGAGLGGGSSDAAAVLRALPLLWERRVSKAALDKLAVKLGADVPFFLRGGLCAAGGIGEKLRPLPKLPRQWLVLVYPGFGVSTKQAYGNVRLPFQNGIPRSLRLPTKGKIGGDRWSKFLFNRFEEFVFPGRPQLPALKERLLAEGATATLMSGSGSSIFGIVNSQGEGKKILSRLRKQYPQSWLVHTTS